MKQIQQPIPPKPPQRRAHIIILGRDSFIGTILRESTTHLFCTWGEKGKACYNGEGEWFARHSRQVMALEITN